MRKVVRGIVGVVNVCIRKETKVLLNCINKLVTQLLLLDIDEY